MLEKVQAIRAMLTPAEQKVADLILSSPERVVDSSIGMLAKAAGVSQPTLVRFARHLGCRGFQDFRLRLAQSLATGTPYVHDSVSAEDSSAQLTEKLFTYLIVTLSQLRDRFDAQALEKAIDLLVPASKVEFYGFGTSGIVAAEAQHKFFRLDVAAVAYSDPHMQSMSAAIMKPGDIVVAISHSGRSTELLSSIRIALNSGASVIAVTTTGSPLAKIATVALLVDVPENSDTNMPMTSHIAHMLVIDMLAIGVALRRGPRLIGQLRKIQQAAARKKTTRGG